MKKTCYNCEHFHGCLGEEGSRFHIHDYCDQLGQCISYDNAMSSEVSSVIHRYIDTYNKAYITARDTVSDDLETGEAVCWMFKAKDTPFWPDEQFDLNRKRNRKIAYQILYYMFTTDRYYDEEGYPYEFYQSTSEEEYESLKKLFDELKIEFAED